MKTKNLQRIGLTKLQIDYVMAENGKDINLVRQKVLQLEGKLSNSEKEKDHLYKAYSELNVTVARYDSLNIEELLDTQKNYEAKLLVLKKQWAMERLFGEIGFASKLAKQQAMLQFEQMAFPFENNQYSGVDEFFKKLKVEDANAFYK